MTNETDAIEYVTQGNYAGSTGWEDVSYEETLTEGRAMLACYRENEPQYPHRLVLREPGQPDQIIN